MLPFAWRKKRLGRGRIYIPIYLKECTRKVAVYLGDLGGRGRVEGKIFIFHPFVHFVTSYHMNVSPIQKYFYKSCVFILFRTQQFKQT